MKLFIGLADAAIVTVRLWNKKKKRINKVNNIQMRYLRAMRHLIFHTGQIKNVVNDKNPDRGLYL